MSVKVSASEVEQHAQFLHAVDRAKKTATVKALLEGSSRQELDLLLRLLVLVVFGKKPCSAEALGVLKKKKKVILKALKSKTKLQRMLKSSDLARMFLKSAAVVLPSVVSCYLEPPSQS